MISHQELLREITQELYHDNNVLALILYGSVSRKEESANSDIDLLAIINEDYLQKRHTVRDGITIEFVEMHIKFLHDFIEKREVPILFALVNGIVLFDKFSVTEQFISDARKIIENGPPVNSLWENEGYKTKKRSDITEIYKDLLDVDDELTFNYITALLIANIIPMLIENNSLWNQTRKKMIKYLKTQCFDCYKYIEALLSPVYSLPEKREAAKSLIEYVLNSQGGLLQGDAVIFRKNG